MARRSEHTREQLADLIVDAACRLVESRGIEGLSARAIAQAIGYTPGTIYLVFSNLDDVVLHLNARTLDQLHAAIAEAVAGDDEPLSRLTRAARGYVAFARAHPGLWRLCFEHRLPEGVAGPAWLDARIERLVALISAPIAEASEADEASVAVAAQALWSGVHGICVLALSNKLHLVGGRSIEALTDDLVANYVTGMLTRRASP